MAAKFRLANFYIVFQTYHEMEVSMGFRLVMGVAPVMKGESLPTAMNSRALAAITGDDCEFGTLDR